MSVRRAAASLVLCIVVLTTMLSGCASIFNEDGDTTLSPTPGPVEMVPQAGVTFSLLFPKKFPRLTL